MTNITRTFNGTPIGQRGDALVAEHNADAAGGTLTLPLGLGRRGRKG